MIKLKENYYYYYYYYYYYESPNAGSVKIV